MSFRISIIVKFCVELPEPHLPQGLAVIFSHRQVYVKRAYYFKTQICLAYISETVMNCDDDYVNKPEKYKCLGNTIDAQNGRLFCISTAALITNIPLTSWGIEMKFTEKIEKELI
jgi:hypothetical protein